MKALSPNAKEALSQCFATRGKNKGQLLARCPRSNTLASAAWQGAMMSCNPYLVSIGALLFMSEEQRAIQIEVMAFFDSLPASTRTAAERNRATLEALGVW